MKPKTMILLGLAITCGLGASYMTSRLLAERQAPEAPETVDILVAKQTINVHTRIVRPEDLFEIKTVSKADEPSDAIHDFEELKGKVLKQGRVKGDSVTRANLYDKFSSVEIPEGHQAIGVRVNLETTAHGLASLPGTRVDLHLTVKAQDLAQTRALVLLENVLVLAADAKTARGDDTIAPAQIVTFALKRDEVLRVNAAMEMGTIRMIMRNQEDKSVAKKGEQQRTGSDILNNQAKLEQPVAKVEAPPPPKVAETKPEPKDEPKPAIVDNRPKVAGPFFYNIVEGSESGERNVRRVEYYRTEDGRIVYPDSPEVEEAHRPLETTPTPTPKSKSSGGTT